MSFYCWLFFSGEDVCLLFKREGVSQIWEQMNRWTNSVPLSPGQILAISVWDLMLLLCQKIKIWWIVLVLLNVVIYGDKYVLLFYCVVPPCSALWCTVLTIFYKGWCFLSCGNQRGPQYWPVSVSCCGYGISGVAYKAIFVCLPTNGKTYSISFFFPNLSCIGVVQ